MCYVTGQNFTTSPSTVAGIPFIARVSSLALREPVCSTNRRWGDSVRTWSCHSWLLQRLFFSLQVKGPSPQRLWSPRPSRSPAGFCLPDFVLLPHPALEEDEDGVTRDTVASSCNYLFQFPENNLKSFSFAYLLETLSLTRQSTFKRSCSKMSEDPILTWRTRPPRFKNSRRDEQKREMWMPLIQLATGRRKKRKIEVWVDMDPLLSWDST